MKTFRLCLAIAGALGAIAAFADDTIQLRWTHSGTFHASSIAYALAGDYYATFGDSEPKIYRASDGQLMRALPMVSSLGGAFVPAGRGLVCIGDRRILRYASWMSGAPTIIASEPNDIEKIAVSPNSDFMAYFVRTSDGGAGQLVLFDLRSNTELYRWNIVHPVHGLKFTRNSAKLVVDGPRVFSTAAPYPLLLNANAFNRAFDLTTDNKFAFGIDATGSTGALNIGKFRLTDGLAMARASVPPDVENRSVAVSSDGGAVGTPTLQPAGTKIIFFRTSDLSPIDSALISTSPADPTLMAMSPTEPRLIAVREGHEAANALGNVDVYGFNSALGTVSYVRSHRDFLGKGEGLTTMRRSNTDDAVYFKDTTMQSASFGGPTGAFLATLSLGYAQSVNADRTVIGDGVTYRNAATGALAVMDATVSDPVWSTAWFDSHVLAVSMHDQVLIKRQSGGSVTDVDSFVVPGADILATSSYDGYVAVKTSLNQVRLLDTVHRTLAAPTTVIPSAAYSSVQYLAFTNANQLWVGYTESGRIGFKIYRITGGALTLLRTFSRPVGIGLGSWAVNPDGDWFALGTQSYAGEFDFQPDLYLYRMGPAPVLAFKYVDQFMGVGFKDIGFSPDSNRLYGANRTLLTCIDVPTTIKSFDVNEPGGAPGATLHCQALLTRQAPAGGMTIQLTSDDARVTMPSSIFVPAGQWGQTFTATIGATSTTANVTLRARIQRVELTRNVLVHP